VAEQRGSKYTKDGIWWVKFPLPIGQTWTDPRTSKIHTKIEISVRTWYRANVVTGKGDNGKSWAKRLLSELNNQYYSGEAMTAANHRTTVERLMKNLISTYAERGKSSEKDAREKLDILKRHGLADLAAASITTDRLRLFRQQRITLDGVESPTVNRDFAYLRRAYRLGMKHTPQLVTSVPFFPFGEDCKRRQGYLTLDLYDKLIELAEDDVRPFFATASHLGIRVGALLQLRWSWIEMWQEVVNEVHGVVRFPPEVIKNGEGFTGVLFGDFGSELRRLYEIRQKNFPTQDHVFVRWGERTVRNGPVLQVDEKQRIEYLRVARWCMSGKMTTEDGAMRLGKSARFIQLLVSRLKSDGPDGILRSALTLRGRQTDARELASTSIAISNATPLKYGYVYARFNEIVTKLNHPDLRMHDMKRTALDIFRKAGLRREDCKQWIGHKTDSMFQWYSIDLNLEDKIEQAAIIQKSMNTRRKAAKA
jgi:integrase